MDACHRRAMASPPRRPSKRKTDAPVATVADRAVVAKPADPRQAGQVDGVGVANAHLDASS